MARASVISPWQKFWDIAGLNPVIGGTVTFYQNMTTTLADIWEDADLSIPQENPYTLDSGGRIQGDVHFNGSLSLLVKDANGAELYTIDNVTCFDPFVAFSDWDASTTYAEGGANIVTGSDGRYYISTANDNMGHDPTFDINQPTWWQEVNFFEGTQEQYDRVVAISNLDPGDQNIIIGNGTTWETATLASIMRNFISGLETANNALDLTHDIDVSPGRCNDSTNAWSLALTSTMTKRLDATWMAGSGNGGRAGGVSLSASTTYHVFVVLIGTAVDVIFDTSAVCANGITNNSVLYFRRVASIMTDGSSLIRRYFQSVDEFVWDTLIQDVSTSNPGVSAITSSLTTPTGVVMRANIMAQLTSGDTAQSGYLLLTAIDQLDQTPSASNSNIISAPQAATFTNTFGAAIHVATNTSRQIRYRLALSSGSTTTNYTVRLNTLGWTDSRGK